MNYIQTEIEGVWIIEPKVFNDARGYFMEAFKEGEFRANIGNVHFVQDNESHSRYGVLRGLHFQKGRCAQSKLVRVIRGCVLDTVWRGIHTHIIEYRCVDLPDYVAVGTCVLHLVLSQDLLGDI